MQKLLLCMLAGLFCWIQPTALWAHFLFIRIGAHAEAGRTAEVYFSERAEAGDPRFIEKIGQTELWMQNEPGKFLPLQVRKGTDRLRAFVPSEGSVSVTGVCEYGVVQRDVAFLLRYFPKAIAGAPEEVNKLVRNEKVSVEITATVGPEGLALVVLDQGKPVPEAVLTTVDAALVNEELKADSEGRVTWKPATPGQYCVYTKVVRKEAGEDHGKKYAEIREFATLAFQWPLGRSDADPQAVALFEKALAARANWQEFPGFAAKIDGDHDGRPFTGTVKIDKDGNVDLKLDQEVASDWVEDQLRSIVLHRKASPRRGAPVVQFADEDEHNPLGRLLTFVGGKFASSYRVKDDQLLVVNRNTGPENMTITVLENEKNAEGKYLPHLYTVQYWDAANGNFLRTETFENCWERIGGFDLPVVDTLTTATAGGFSVRSFRLSKHELLPTK